jgi:hypothetical protein
MWSSLHAKNSMQLHLASVGLNSGLGYVFEIGVRGGTWYKTRLKKDEITFTFPSIQTQRAGDKNVTAVTNYLSSVKYAGNWWCIGPRAPLFCVQDGKIVQDATKPLPTALYIMQFFDHLVVGNYTLHGNYNPRGVACSDLYKPWDWSATPENESDAWEVEEFATQDGATAGVTGFSQQGERLTVYTDSSIHAFEYVGMPNIMRYSRLRPDIGNCLPRGLVRYGGYDFFFDRGTFNFYQYDGQGLQQIGDKILAFVLSSIAPDVADAPNVMFEYTRGFVLPKWNLVCWSFPVYEPWYSTYYRYNFVNIGYNPFTKTWIHWKHTSVNNATFENSPLGQSDVVGPIDGSTPDVIDEWAGFINDAGNFINEEPGLADQQVPSQLFFHDDKIVKEQVGSEETVRETNPVLETGDRVYGSLDRVKEVHGIALHSSYSSGAGVEVSVAARSNISDAVTWRVVGVWNPNLPDKRLTFPAVSGKIFRFRFRGLGDPSVGAIRGWRLDAFSEFVYGNSAER